MFDDAKFSFFEDNFLRTFESWFSADIVCCSECIDDFLKIWPYLYEFNLGEFQRNCIGMDEIFYGSRLRDVYSYNIFCSLLANIKCPRCGMPVGDHVYPYNFPFAIDDIRHFESEIKEVAIIARRTPFLLLRHDLARRVLDVIKALGMSAEINELACPVWRGRSYSADASYSADDFKFPPSHIVKDGRYNHTGIPVLYVGNSVETCFYELRQRPCVVAQLISNEKIKILDLSCFFRGPGESASLINALVYSSLLSAKNNSTDRYNQEYIFSRFVADCARDAGFDAIKYPSTRIFKENYNIVILNAAWNFDVTSAIFFDGTRQHDVVLQQKAQSNPK